MNPTSKQGTARGDNPTRAYRLDRGEKMTYTNVRHVTSAQYKKNIAVRLTLINNFTYLFSKINIINSQ